MKKRGCRKNCRMKIVLSLAITASMTAALLMGCSGAGGKRDASDQAGQTSSESVSAMPGTEQTISGSSAAESASAVTDPDSTAAESASAVSGTEQAGPDNSAAESASAVSGTEQAGPDSTAAESVIASKEKSLPMDTETASEAVVYGDERADLYLPLLEGKRTAVFSNQTGIVGNAIIEEEPAESAAGDVPMDTGINAETESDKGEDMEGSEDREDSEDWEDSRAAADSAQAEGLVPFGQNADGTPMEYGEHILDALIRQGVDVTVAFSPEHGFRGTEDAGAQVESYTDEKTGVPVVSLYGSGSMYPSDADLDRFDTLVVDIQDVGLRFYTYYISMFYLMDACAEAGKEVVILDRPNPNGFYVDGPILQDGFYSGVGMLPIPVVHGMTLGELAQMINGEGWLPAGKDACSLTVVPCDHYRHDILTGLVTCPSPNLKDMRAVYLYPSTCLFEKTACSVGRGTAHPFEIFGSPWLQGTEGYDFTFTPEDMEGAHSPAFQGQTCYGKDLREIPLAQILDEHFNLDYVIETRNIMKIQNPGISFFGSPDGDGHYWIDYLCGTDRVRLMIEEGRSAEEISASWQEDVEAFKAQRRPYLLYEE